MAGDARKEVRISYHDLPELSETFADSIHQWAFDGSTLRIEFAVSRPDREQDPQSPHVNRYPAARMVLPMSGIVELLARCQQLARVFEQARQAQLAKETEKAPASSATPN